MGNIINLKLIVLGEGEVGKTSIVNTFIEEEFPERYMPTIGSITFKKEFKLKGKTNIIRLTIWDLGGQKSFNPFNPAHYANADLAILVFDLTKPEITLKNLKKEFQEKISKSSEECISLFVGNKLDLLKDGDHFKNTLQGYFSDRDHFILTSAKTGLNIRDCFELLIYTYLKRTELLAPELVQENTADDFLQLIGKAENNLKSKLVNLKSIDYALGELTSIVESKADDSIKDDTSELKYHEFIQEELYKVGNQKDNIHDQFLINLSELEKALNHVKKTQIKSAGQVIETIRDLLTNSKNDSEKNIELIQKLNREETELMIINSKLKNEKKTQVNSKDPIPKNNIYNF
ncbi:MAG: Rab family GTPase [Promethearchaeota archaeon]